jgi:hypothetical protein
MIDHTPTASVAATSATTTANERTCNLTDHDRPRITSDEVQLVAGGD